MPFGYLHEIFRFDFFFILYWKKQFFFVRKSNNYMLFSNEASIATKMKMEIIEINELDHFIWILFSIFSLYVCVCVPFIWFKVNFDNGKRQYKHDETIQDSLCVVWFHLMRISICFIFFFVLWNKCSIDWWVKSDNQTLE